MGKLKPNHAIRLVAAADVAHLASVLTLVNGAAMDLGLGRAKARELEHAVDEVITNVIQHAFEPGERGEYQVTIGKEGNLIIVEVEDQGLPFDLERFERGQDAGLGYALLRHYADEFAWQNLGRQGKRVTIKKTMDVSSADDHYAAADLSDTKNAPMAPLDEKLSLRMMKPDEAVNLARCVYRCYGYTYTSATIYHPEKTRSLMEAGLMDSAVALNRAGEIVGHIALIRETPDDKVGETGQAIVDPRYRKRGLFKKTKQLLLDHARQKGLYGVFSESVTIHPYTQMGNISLGGSETGLMLGYAPQQIGFRKIEDQQAQRQAVMLFFIGLNQGPARDTHAPRHHLPTIRRILDKAGLERRFPSHEPGAEKKEPQCRLDVLVRMEWGQAFIKAVQPGADFGRQLASHLKGLCLRRVSCIYLDLPLNSPAAPGLCAQAEDLGFYFAGLIPELGAGGDILRLQYLNNVFQDLSKIKAVSGLGNGLLEYTSSQPGCVHSKAAQ